MILHTVRRDPAVRFNRSELAKLLCGSASVRTEKYKDHAAFGKLKQYSRKSVMQDIDILIQQGEMVVSADNTLKLR